MTAKQMKAQISKELIAEFTRLYGKCPSKLSSQALREKAEVWRIKAGKEVWRECPAYVKWIEFKELAIVMEKWELRHEAFWRGVLTCNNAVINLLNVK